MTKDKFPTQDQGELAVRAYVSGRVIVLDFGKDVSWLGLKKADAENMIKVLQEQLDRLEKK